MPKVFVSRNLQNSISSFSILDGALITQSVHASYSIGNVVVS